MPFENLKHIKLDVTHLCVCGCGTYVFLLEEVCVNKLNPKSELMTFLDYPQGTKGYLFVRGRGPNNVLFIAVQALFDETLFLKCLDMRCPGYTPVAPVNAQGEYNIPLEDNENGGVRHLGLHHLGDLCLIRHLCPDHCLKTRAKVGTLIPWFCQN